MLDSDEETLRLLFEILDALRAANAPPSPQGDDGGGSVDNGEERRESSRLALAAAEARTAAAIDETRAGIQSICALLEERL